LKRAADHATDDESRPGQIRIDDLDGRLQRADGGGDGVAGTAAGHGHDLPPMKLAFRARSEPLPPYRGEIRTSGRGPNSGHFAAMEAPDLLVNDVRELFKTLR
jgi:hypothetical protein